MNKYQGINPFIVALVEKYAKSLYARFHKRIDLEDLQQDLMFSVIRSLENFDPQRGFIKSFIKKNLYNKSFDISRNLQRKKISILCNALQIEAIKQHPHSYDDYTAMELNKLLNSVPEGSRIKIQNLIRSKFGVSEYSSIFKLIKKILSPIINEEGETTKMKNISCIETLSVRELSKLSEVDLCDLSEKISETHNWIKQLVEKFEIALATKYSAEAREKLQESGTDFGTCELKKDAFTVTIQLPKKVQWDQKILKDMYKELSPKGLEDTFKVIYSIDERVYSKLDDVLRNYLSRARTTTYGKVKISINKTKGAQ